MHIIYLHQYFRTPDMGGGTRSFEMARRLVAWGHRVDLITADTSASGARRGWRVTDEAGIRVHWFPVPYHNAMGRSARLRAFFRFALNSSLRALSIPADVVFASSTPLTIAVPAMAVRYGRRIPLVFEVRDLWPAVPVALGELTNPLLVWAARQLEVRAYAASAKVVALSPDMADGVVAGGVDRKDVVLIPNASDLELFDPDPVAAQAFRRRNAWLGERPLVVYAGTFGRVNGVGYLARLAAAVRPLDPEIRFLVVGDGKEWDLVAEQARELGVLGETFFMMPPVSKYEVAAMLAAADLATSVVIDVEALWGNSANKLFDGLAAATPFVINHGGWQADLLRSEEAGLVLPPRDIDAAARIVAAALADREWCARAARNARRLAETLFSRDVLVHRLEATLQAAVAAGRHRSPDAGEG